VESAGPPIAVSKKPTLTIVPLTEQCPGTCFSTASKYSLNSAAVIEILRHQDQREMTDFKKGKG
jgi:hypothetical protein